MRHGRLRAPDSERDMADGAKIAKRFRALADRMEKTIQDRLDPAIGRARPTRRRAEIARGMIAEGMGLQRLQGAMRKLARAWENGTIPEELRGLRTKADVSFMLDIVRSIETEKSDAARYGDIEKERWKRLWECWMFPSDLYHLAEYAKGKRGISKHAKSLISWARRLGEDADHFGTNTELYRTLSDIVKYAKKKKDRGIEVYVRGLESCARAAKLGFADRESWIRGVEVFRDFISGIETDDSVRKRARSIEQTAKLASMKIPGYFPTPPKVADMMVAKANIRSGGRVLEPSAGSGAIAEAIRRAHPDVHIDVIEIQQTLRNILKSKGFNIVASDFLEYHPGAIYDAIVMNPPFERNQDIAHVRHAFELVRPGGRVVALLGEGAFFRRGRVETEFRSWLSEHGVTLENGEKSVKLAPGTFRMSGTGANARMIVLEKEYEMENCLGLKDFVDDPSRSFSVDIPVFCVGHPVVSRVYQKPSRTPIDNARLEWRKWRKSVWPPKPASGNRYGHDAFRRAIWLVRNTEPALALDEWAFKKWKNIVRLLIPSDEVNRGKFIVDSLSREVFGGPEPSLLIEHAVSRRLIDPVTGKADAGVKMTEDTLKDAWTRYAVPELKSIVGTMLYLSEPWIWDRSSDPDEILRYLAPRVGSSISWIVLRAHGISPFNSDEKRLVEMGKMSIRELVSKHEKEEVEAKERYEAVEAWQGKVYNDIHAVCLRISDEGRALNIGNFKRFMSDSYSFEWHAGWRGIWHLYIRDSRAPGFQLVADGTRRGKMSALEALCERAAAKASPTVRAIAKIAKKKRGKRAKWRRAKRRTPKLDTAAKAALTRAKKRGDELDIAAVNTYLLLPKDEEKYAALERSRARKAEERKRSYRPRLPSGKRYRVLKSGSDCDVIGRLVEVADCRQGDAIAGQIKNGECLVPSRGTIYDERNRRYEYKVEVVPPEKIRASHDIHFRPTPGYPPEFQARDRSSKESQLDVTQMASHFDPERFAQVGPTPVEGSPVVWGRNRDVLAGNGRMLAFLLASPSIQEEYYDLIEDLTGKRGVLVRRLVGASKDQAVNFAAASQRSASAPESPIERAIASVRSLSIKTLSDLPPGFYFDDKPRILRGDNVTAFEIDNRSFVDLVYPHGGPALASDRAERYREVLLGLLPSAAHETIQAGGEKVEQAFTGLAPYLAQLHGMRVFREDPEFRSAYDPIPRLERAAKLMRRFKGKSRNQIFQQLTEDLQNRHMFVDEGNPIFSMEAADIGWVYGLLGSVGLRNPEMTGAEIGAKLYDFVRKEAERLGTAGETAAFFEVDPPNPLDQVDAVFGPRIGEKTRKFAQNLEDLGIGDATRELVARNPVLLLGNPTSRWEPVPGIFLPGIEWRRDGSTVRYRGTYVVNTLFRGSVPVDVSGSVPAIGPEDDIAASILEDINNFVESHPEVLEGEKAKPKEDDGCDLQSPPAKRRRRKSKGQDDIFQHDLFDLPGQRGLFTPPTKPVEAMNRHELEDEVRRLRAENARLRSMLPQLYHYSSDDAYENPAGMGRAKQLGEEILSAPYTLNVADISYEEGLRYAEEQFRRAGLDLYEEIPNFRENWRLLKDSMRWATDIQRIDMPVIEPGSQMEEFDARLREGHIDIFKPHVRLRDSMGRFMPRYPKQFESSYAKSWVTLGVLDGDPDDDVIHSVWTKIPARQLKPLQAEIWFDKVIGSILRFGKPGAGSRVLETTVIVSQEGYILDGHHRFGQTMLVNPDLKMAALFIPLPISELVKIGRSYGAAIGNKQKA